MTDEEPSPSAVFETLGHEVRVGVLQALADRAREHPDDPVLGFADLRRAVDVEDSGRFRYHLERLLGTFVERTDDGYVLTAAGARVVVGILAGRFTGQVSVDPAPLDSACSICGAAAVGRYEAGTLLVACEDGHPLFGWRVPPNAAADATVPELVELATLLVRRSFDLVRAGYCPQCYSAVEPRIEGVGATDADGPHAADEEPDLDAAPRDAAGPSIRFRATCGACGGRIDGPVGFCLLSDPAVASFYRERTGPITEHFPWELDFVGDDAVHAVADPGAVRVDVRLADDLLSVTLDDSGSVVETSWPE